MTSRISFETNLLRIHEVFCYNPRNNTAIASNSFPKTSADGRLVWLSSLELLSSIQYPTSNTNLLDFLSTIPVQFSTFSTLIYSSVNSFGSSLTSTVDGLGTAGYVSSQTLDYRLTNFVFDEELVTASSMYTIINNFGNMNTLSTLFPLNIQPYGFKGGYISTLFPGEYRTYYSTVGFGGSNLYNQSFNNASNTGSVVVDISGYSNHIVSTSKMSIDIFPNMTLDVSGGLNFPASLSSFLTYNGAKKGLANVIQPRIGVSNVNIGSLRYLLTWNDLYPTYPSSLTLTHRFLTADNQTGVLNTFTPIQGGIFVTLDNTN
jgi:hypothetical protein